MSSDNVASSVASGNSPQPNAGEGQATNLDADAIANDIVGEDSDDSGSEAPASATPEQAINAAQKSGEISKKEAQNLKRQLKLKIDGQEENVEIDLGDEAAIVRELQKSRAFDKRSKELASYKNQVETFLQQLKENPESILEKMGFNVDDMSEKRLQKRIEQMNKTPEQQAREKLEAELEDYKKKEKEAQAKAQQAEQESLRNKHAAQIENEIENALTTGKSKLPQRNPRVIARISQTMLWAMQNGYPDVQVKDVIPYVEKEWQEELRSYFDTSAEDLIEELVGKQNLERMRKKRLANRPKAPVAAAKNIQDTGKKGEEKQEDKPKKRMKDVFSIYD